MTERKSTDEEVIKALETVSYGGHSCEKCKFKTSKGDDRCGLKGCNICRLALDLINRKNAEIERLEEENRRMKKYYFTHDYHECHNEAIKEFAASLKERTYPFPCAIGVENAVTIRAINDLVKELTEENKGQAVSV